MKQGLKILAVLRSDEQVGNVETALNDVADIKYEVLVSDFQSVAPKLINGAVPDLLLVDVAFDEGGDLNELSHLLRDHASDMAVVATAQDQNFEGVRRLMRMGVSDFIPQPINPIDVRGAVEVATSKLTQRPRGVDGVVFSFIRSCGGAGATTLAIQAAAELAGDRKDPKRVCLIDFDLQLGNIAIALDIKDNVGLRQIIENPDRLDDEYIMGAVTHHSSGIDILAAPDVILPMEAMTPELAEQIMFWARRHYDFVVIDMPHAWTNWTGYVLGASDLITLVTEVSVTAMQRCKRQFDILAQQELEDVPLAVVVNRFKQNLTTKSRAKQAESALGRRIDYFIRPDASTANAARDQGVLLREIKRKSAIEKDMSKFLAEVRKAMDVARTPAVQSAA